MAGKRGEVRESKIRRQTASSVRARKKASTPPHVEDLIGGIYESALDWSLWPRTLERLCNALDCAGVNLFLADPRNGTAIEWASHELDGDRLVEYAEHLAPIDPRMRHALRHREIAVCFDYQHMTESEIDRSEYYAWCQAENQLRYYMGSALDIDPHARLGIAFLRTRRQGHVERPQVELLSRLVPHFRRAVQVSRRLAAARRDTASYLNALDLLPQAVVLIGGRGDVLHVNRAAGAILGQNDGLLIVRRQLVAALPSETAALARLIAEASRTGSGQSDHPGGAVLVSRPSMRRPFAILVAPLLVRDWTRMTGGISDPPAAVVFLGDPEPECEQPGEALSRLYGLTPAEARLCLALLALTNLKDAADRCGLTQGTARQYLKSVFQKTGTRNQLELIKLMLTIPVPSLRQP